MKKLFPELIILVFLISILSPLLFVKAQSDTPSTPIELNQTYGGTGSETAYSVIQKELQIGIAPYNSTNATSNEPIPELSWTQGNPFPTVSGNTVFPAVAPLAYSTHWYAGGAYSGQTTQNALTISMSIRVPYSAPLSDEFYYVLLSTIDSNESCNQIGFSAFSGVWGLTYSWTTYSQGNLIYHFSPDAMALSLGVAYTFNITTESGVTQFIAYQGSTPVWSLDAPTGGNYLIPSYSTDDEEVWQTDTSGGSPAFDFYFYNNYWVSQTGISNSAIWSPFYDGAPSNVTVVISGNSVLVNNPLGTVLFETNPTSFATSPGTITFSGHTYSNGQTGEYAHSNYQANANAPTDYQFDYWEYSGSSGSGVYVPNISANPTTVQVYGDGWLQAIFSAKITFYTNTPSGGSITWGSGPSYTYGQTLWETDLPPNYGNTVIITANPPTGYTFSFWSVSGMLSVASSSSNPTTLTVNGPGNITANFAPLQSQVTFNYQVSGGGSGYSAPSVTYTSLGLPQTVTAGPTATVWADSGSTYNYSTNPLTGSNGGERWQASNGTSGTISSSATIAPIYYHQYMMNLSYVVSGGGSPTTPTFTASKFGSSTPVTLTGSATGSWFDASAAWSVTNPLGGSSGSERWQTNQAVSGTVSAASTTVFAYYHQYLQTLSYSVSGGGSPTAPTATGTALGVAYAPSLTNSATGYWFDASGSITIRTPTSGSTEQWAPSPGKRLVVYP
jgi:hypothetical protein